LQRLYYYIKSITEEDQVSMTILKDKKHSQCVNINEIMYNSSYIKKKMVTVAELFVSNCSACPGFGECYYGKN